MAYFYLAQRKNLPVDPNMLTLLERWRRRQLQQGRVLIVRSRYILPLGKTFAAPATPATQERKGTVQLWHNSSAAGDSYH